jgi:hypothetical protein
MSRNLTLAESVALATQLRGSNARTLAVKDVIHMAADVLSHAIPLLLQTRPEHIWYRGRICNSPDEFPNLTKVIHRRDPSDFGRANVPGRSAFYASWNILTVLDEISAATGQFIHIVAARVLPTHSVPFTIFGELTHLVHAGQTRLPAPTLKGQLSELCRLVDLDTQRRWLYLDGFISEEFRKIRSKPIEYQITAALAEAAYEQQVAVAYPSVETYGAQNIAIPAALFDARMEVVHTEVLRVDKFHGQGVYELEPIRSSNDFEVDGQINWNSKLPPFKREPSNSQLIVPIDYVGWRPPKLASR